MERSRLEEFVVTTLLIQTISLTFGALFSPPDPFAQLYWAAPLFVLAPPVAYWLVYRDGWDRLGTRPVEYSRPFVFFAAFVLVLVAGSGLTDVAATNYAMAQVVRAAAFAAGLVLAAWLGYYGGYGVVRERLSG
jgi:hypothetical protein